MTGCRIAAVNREAQFAVKRIVSRVGLYERAAAVGDEDIVALLGFGISAEEIEKAELRELCVGIRNEIFIFCADIDAAVFYLIIDDKLESYIVFFIFFFVCSCSVGSENISNTQSIVGKAALGILERHTVILSVELIECVSADYFKGRRCGARILLSRERRPELFAVVMGKIGDADGICALVKEQLDKSGFADLLKIGFIADGMEQSRFRSTRLGGRAFYFRHGDGVGARAQGAEHCRRKQQSRYPRRYSFFPVFNSHNKISHIYKIAALR